MWRIVAIRSPRRVLVPIIFISLLFFLYGQLITHSIRNEKQGEQKAQSRSFENTGIPRGKVNLDIWRGMSSLSFNSLRQHPFFPSHPSNRSFLEISNSLKIDVEGSSFGLRVVGYLHPPTSGYYSFYLHSYFMAQFWLSTNGPQTASKVAYTTLNKLDKLVYTVGNSFPISSKIFLKHDKKYYFEILKVLNSGISKGQNVIETRLEWMLPKQTFFTKIDGKYLSPYLNVSGNVSRSNHLDNASPSLRVSDEEDRAVGPIFPPDKHAKAFKFQEFNRQNIRGLPYLEREYSLKAFPKCRYISRFMQRKKYSGYRGVFTILYPKIYPDDLSASVRFTNVYKAFAGDDRHNGSTLLSEAEAESVVASFMDGFHRVYPGTFELVDIVHIENVHDKERGERFLLDLVVKHRQDNKLLRVSEFMYRNKSHSDLCILEDLGWNPKVWINVILNVKNQADWVVHFIKDVSRVMKETGDQHINVIIVDYGNNGLDIGQEMQRYGIKNYEVINQTGVFHKTASINLAASRVKDPNSIVLLMDLHLQLSLDFFDKIRKHTFQGILAFSPIVFRLDSCGRPRTKHLCPSGFWESLGFGIFGIYKSDWDRFGGMNVKEFTNKWGGEDWEMVDRVLSSGIEIDKQRLPGFYHFYHDKKGMWNS